jgi:hypothetical protein
LKKFENTKQYEKRLKVFLEEIQELATSSDTANPIHTIMDSVPFKDLEIALMMAKMEQAGATTSLAA